MLRLVSLVYAISLLLALPLSAAETRGLRVVAKDPATNESAEVKLYNKSYAVVIGIDQYQNLTADRQLHNAVRDAKGVAEVLQKNYRFDRIYSLYNRDATKEKIMKLLTSELPKGMGEEDSVFIFWAGHGNQETTAEGDIGYLIPFDGSTDEIYRNITMTEIRDTISKKIPAKHVFYVMDACYSGLLASRSVDVKTRRDLKYLQSITKERVRQVLTAGGKGEEVLDGGPKGHSVFTGRLIEALEAAGDFITANEIQAILKERVYGDALGRGKAQTPGFGTLAGSGDFVFVPNIEQKAADAKAELQKAQLEMAELEKQEAAAQKARDEAKRRQAEEARRIVEARIRAEQLKVQKLADEERKRAEEEQERKRQAQAKAADEKRLATLKADMDRRKQQLQNAAGKTDTIEEAVTEIRRLNNRIAEIETNFATELEGSRQQVRQRYEAKLAALAQQEKDEFESRAEYEQRIDRQRGQLESDCDVELKALTPEVAAAAETAPLKHAIRTLSERTYTLGAESVAVELGSYNPDRQNFPVTLRSTSSSIKVAMNGTIPLPRDAARSFKQQYQAGAIRPQLNMKTNGDIMTVALANDSDNSIYEYYDGEFITVAEKKRREAERERLIYTDPRTGLQWARTGNIAGKAMTWNDAMNWVKHLNHAGYSDWRLPTKDELESFAKRGGERPSQWLNANGFTAVQAVYYWSSTTNAYSTTYAWIVNLGDGYTDSYDGKAINGYVWPVRGGQ